MKFADYFTLRPGTTIIVKLMVLALVMISTSVRADDCSSRTASSMNLDALGASAEAGNIDASTELGLIYLFADGIERNETKALSWLERAAGGGSHRAQYFLAAYYEDHIHTDDDWRKAVKFFRQAAGPDCPAALWELGSLAALGRGEPQDDKKAFQLYLKAAQLGHVNAQVMVASLMSNGKGVAKNPEEAFRWVKIAADTHSSAALDLLAKFYYGGVGTKQSMKSAVDVWRVLYDIKDVWAPGSAYFIGLVYMDGAPDVPEDDAQALRWMILAADSNQAQAVQKLAALQPRFPEKAVLNDCKLYTDPDLKRFVEIKPGEAVLLVKQNSNEDKKMSEVYYAPGVFEGFVPEDCLGK